MIVHVFFYRQSMKMSNLILIHCYITAYVRAMCNCGISCMDLHCFRLLHIKCFEYLLVLDVEYALYQLDDIHVCLCVEGAEW